MKRLFLVFSILAFAALSGCKLDLADVDTGQKEASENALLTLDVMVSGSYVSVRSSASPAEMTDRKSVV